MTAGGDDGPAAPARLAVDQLVLAGLSGRPSGSCLAALQAMYYRAMLGGAVEDGGGSEHQVATNATLGM